MFNTYIPEQHVVKPHSSPLSYAVCRRLSVKKTRPKANRILFHLVRGESYNRVLIISNGPRANEFGAPILGTHATSISTKVESVCNSSLCGHYTATLAR